MQAMKHTSVLLAALLLLVHAPAFAQVDQGDMTNRSDVKMSIEGAMGTGGERLNALAKQLGTPLGELKRCYAELVKQHPEVTGTLLVDLELPDKGGLRVAPVGAENLNKGMRKCVETAFKKVTGKGVERPAKARVVLELTNAAAAKVDDLRASEQAASHVDVKTDAQGRSFSEGHSIQGEIDYRVAASGADAKGVVERVHTAVRDTLPSLFDCRRKSGKLGSPEGDIVIDVTLAPKGTPKVEVRSNTVQSERATPCVDKALTQGLADRGRGKAEITLHFTP